MLHLPGHREDAPALATHGPLEMKRFNSMSSGAELRLWRVSALVWLGIATTVQAAPPSVSSLLPAGGQRGTEVAVTLQGTPGATVPEVWCHRPGLEFVRPEKPGPITVRIAADAQPGLYWLRFYNAEGSSTLRPFYVGTQPEVLEVEPNNSIRKPQALPSTRVVVNGVLAKAEDADVYAIPLTKGQTVVASVAAFEDLGSPMDAVLQILSPAGFVLEQNEDDQGWDPRITFTAPDDGTYFARLFAFPATPDSSIRLAGGTDYVYRLTISTGSFPDHVWPLALPVGESVGLTAFNAGGQEFPEKGALNVTEAGPQRAWLDVWDGPAWVVGSTAPLVQETLPETDAAQVLPAVPATIMGRLGHSGDVDRYRFALTKDRVIEIEAFSRAIGSPLDPVVKISDAAGKVLKELDDLGNKPDPRFDFTAPADGEYEVQISERFGDGGPRGVYVLAIRDLEAAARLTVAADSFVVTGDKPLEIAISVERIAGFDEEITVSAIDLPEGVTAEPVVAKPKEAAAQKGGRRRGRSGANATDTATLKLVSTRPEGFRGPLIIVGKTAGDEPREFRVEANIKSPDTQAPYVWLTVVPPKK